MIDNVSYAQYRWVCELSVHAIEIGIKPQITLQSSIESNAPIAA